MYIILSHDAKSSLLLQCDIAGNASEVNYLVLRNGRLAARK